MSGTHSASSTPELSIVEAPAATTKRDQLTVALVGNPNAGKTSLFNRLTGLRARTANFAGTTIEHRIGAVRLAEHNALLVDLPGMYSLDAATPDEQVASDALAGNLPGRDAPDAVLLVLDATNLTRNLFLAAQVLELKQPTLIALNMSDAAEQQGLAIDLEKLREHLGCDIVTVSAKTGEGFGRLCDAMNGLLDKLQPPAFQTPEQCAGCCGCQYSARYDWAESVGGAAVRGGSEAHSRLTDALDTILTHRVLGVAAFSLVMLLTFVLIFWLATFPMDLIEGLFEFTSGTVAAWLPEGDFSSLVTDGLIAGVGGVLVFLPQIAILFFAIALLEDTGYLARAAFVMDRLMARVGLPGKAFVPLLSAHACAIPAIMSARVIDDRRDRLLTILVAPLLTCSARVPVYVMVISLLLGDKPLAAAAVFAGCYALGIVAAFAMAWVFRKTLLPGKPRPLVIELPNYRVPSLSGALLQTRDRCWSFIKNAGTVILLISVVMWALATYPKTDLADLSAAQQAEIAAAVEAGDEAAAEKLLGQAQLERSLAGRIGQFIQPVFAPLGFDWKVSVGVISSFAAREVVVSTMAVLYGLGDDTAEDDQTLIGSLRASTHPDGSAVFTVPMALSLLIFYVLAMQCLPTQAVTARETGSWKWAGLQLGYMSLLAYGAALVTYQAALACGF